MSRAILTLIPSRIPENIFDFFEGDETITPPPKTNTNVEFAQDEDERDILRLFRKLDRKQKHEFMAKAYAYEALMLLKEE